MVVLRVVAIVFLIGKTITLNSNIYAYGGDSSDGSGYSGAGGEGQF